MSHAPQLPQPLSSTTDLMVISQEKANLARIRDNQRRSRARRKEYLQELEARLRQCELQGIEASAEIQLAARRVADENKKLRMLLGQHGVGDENVEAFLQNAPGPEMLVSSGSLVGLGNVGSGTVQVLENLLNTRKQCWSDTGTCAPGPRATISGARSRGSSAGSMTTVQSLWDPAYTNHMQQPQTDSPNVTTVGKQSQHQPMTPTSGANHIGSVVTIRRGSLSAQQQVPQQAQQQAHQQMHHQAQHQVHHQQQQQQSHMNSNPPSIPRSTSTTPTTAQQSQPHFDYNPQIAPPPSFHNQQRRRHTSHNVATANQLAQGCNQPHQLAANLRSNQYVPDASTGNVIGGTNCVFATDMITSMAGGDPGTVRAELGCMPNCDADMDCEVNNQIVFNVMDRYTGQGIGH